MSDYHIREVAKDLKTVNVVFHLPIPATNNTVGTAWRGAVVAHKGGADAITSVLLDILSADLTKMKSGELVESAFTMRFSSIALTDAQRLAEVEARYSLELSAVLANLQATLKYYGKAGDV